MSDTKVPTIIHKIATISDKIYLKRSNIKWEGKYVKYSSLDFLNKFTWIAPELQWNHKLNLKEDKRSEPRLFNHIIRD